MSTERFLRTALVVSLAAQLMFLVSAGDLFDNVALNGLVSQFPLLLSVAVLLVRARAHPAERGWLVPIASGICMFNVGWDLFFVIPAGAASGIGPVATQIAYVAVYPFLLAGILLALRQRLRHARLIVALDGLSGALAGAAATSCLVSPLFTLAWDGSSAAMFGLALVFGDVLLVAASLGALAAVGTAQGRNFAVWALGMLVFTVGDIVFAYQLAFDSYRVGTALDSLWMIGLGLIAIGATTRSEPQEMHVPPRRSQAVVALASVAGVTVLTAGPDWHANPVPSILALATILGCGVRLSLAFVQLRELAAVREQALTDDLTSAGNRRALYRRLDDLLGLPGEAPGLVPPPSFSLALVDLDHFKEVNDSFGHATGDELLQAVVGRFSEALDRLGTPYLLTRLGADEFAIVLDGVASQDAAFACGTLLQASLEEPIEVRDVVLHVRASIGVALAPDHAQTRSDMLFAADAAMYTAKTSGESVCFYSPMAAGDRRNRLEVAEDLYSALERDELVLEYQPIMSAAGQLVGGEALVRWDHPTRGRLAPDDFLPVAERYRMTPAIAVRVLDVALTDLGRWRATGVEIGVSVNVSASDLHDDYLVNIVAAALLKHGVRPSALTIEITETAMMRDPKTAQATMQALHGLGVELSVDDYGTGYSSLEYLLKLPINEIKLDRAFSASVATEERSVAIVRSTVDLTHALGLRMVAEGVEDESTLVVLRELGCDLVQGWHLARPMPAAAFQSLVQEQLAVRPVVVQPL